MLGYVYIEALPDEQVTVFYSQDHLHEPETQNTLSQVLKSTPNACFTSVPLEELRNLQKKGVGNLSEKAMSSEQQAKVVAFFKMAKQKKASDIHFLIGMNDVCIVQLRIHGELQTIAQLEKQEGLTLASTIIMSMCDVTEKSFNPNRPQDGRVRKEFLNELGLFGARYAHTPAEFGLYVVMRVLPDDGSQPPTLEELGFLPQQRLLIERMLARPEGIIIISGPTGSGKSTSLRSFSDYYLTLTNYQKRLYTLEDPPEGLIYGAVQSPVIADKSDPDAVSLAWTRSISASLRLDPDAMIIGEIRDSHSLRSALTAAKSGHLVQTTLHANDALGIIDRLTDTLDVPLNHVADADVLIGLIAQRLIQLLCPFCKQDWTKVCGRLTPEQSQFILRHCDPDKVFFRNRQGCSHCVTGITGRKIIAEVLSPDAEFMTRYRQVGKAAAKHYWLTSLQGITKRQHAEYYLNAGLVDPFDLDNQSPLDEKGWQFLDEEGSCNA
ncbi:GspE/PulE family protein [Rosenbergiella nectarea]|uniref:GspE/PulE family protein n=1 Tax=Rosenbergiella nectarea TaxID=988801 RepID=UPI001F4E5188|nr:ATPase, T2SS/T4P/T4SS family [Rosenbergiella nectarea]